MKITKNQLRKIIKEEIKKTLSEEETAPGFMDINTDQRAFWIFDMWIPESVEKMQRIAQKLERSARFHGTMDKLGDDIRKDFVNWAHRKAYDEARDNMRRDWEGNEDDDDAWLDYVEEFEHKLINRKEELLNSDELLGKIEEILEWDKHDWVRAGLSVAPDY